ncbi:SDR family oxidoreductase [Demequina sediminicola]|uniref:SDR family oxidoreductase n=1 Tax=Demequina sediminicola TaxID=1095026 RepID=UPI00078233BF|nr:SDR family oxidoreductase [Demequina sediminicola]
MTTPQRIAIVGGHGKIARRLIPILNSRGHTVVATARKEEHLIALASLGATPVRLDIEDSTNGDFADVFKDCDAVVFAAGGGADGNIERKRTVDLEGSLKSIAGAQQAGAQRLVQISAIGVDNPLPDDVEPVWKAYVEAKRDADAALRDSDLDWTIIRPGGLTDDVPTGLIQVAETVERSTIPRADVAHAVADCLDQDSTIGRQWELVAGDTPVLRALQAATDN